MRVLAVIDSLEQGGAERSLVDLIAPLARLGVEVDVVSLRPRGALSAAAEATGARVTHLGVRGRRAAALALRRLLAERRPDLVHTTLYEANLAGRVAAVSRRVPVVTSLVNTPYGADHLAEPGLRASRVRLAQALDVATCRGVRRFHANSDDVAATMRRRLVVRSSKIDVVPRGRDPEALGRRGDDRRRAVRAALGVGTGRPLVLAVARHEANKGLDVLVDAVGRLDARWRGDVEVVVAGREGNASAALRAQIDAGGVPVRLLGHRDDVADLLAAADVFVLASRREGFPGVVVEAMALEAPVVATAVPGTLEALGARGPGVAETGLVVPVDDAAALVAGIERVLDDPAAAAARARRARARFEDRFTIDAVAHDMAVFYERALARPTPGGSPLRRPSRRAG